MPSFIRGSGLPLTCERLRELLHYDPVAGIFTRLVSLANSSRVGAPTGQRHRMGYKCISVDGALHLSHRLAWLYMTGEWPKNNIDHKNGRRDDNRWANLRDVPQRVNLENQNKPNTKNTSGYLGVEVHRNKFHARITANGNRHYLGTFETPEAAHDAYVKAKRKLHEGCML